MPLSPSCAMLDKYSQAVDHPVSSSVSSNSCYIYIHAVYIARRAFYSFSMTFASRLSIMYSLLYCIKLQKILYAWKSHYRALLMHRHSWALNLALSCTFLLLFHPLPQLILHILIYILNPEIELYQMIYILPWCCAIWNIASQREKAAIS